jgi:transposase-like protein
MFLERGVVFTHEAVRAWETKLAPMLREPLRKLRRGKVGRKWDCGEPYEKKYAFLISGTKLFFFSGLSRI